MSPYEHGAIGTAYYGGTFSYNGVYAVQSADDGFELINGPAVIGEDPDGNSTYNLVYRVTTKPPNGNCFESGTGIWSSLTAFYVFDFCTSNPNGAFVMVKPINSMFQSTYISGSDTGGSGTITIENYKGSDGNWYAMLWNFQTGTWEQEAEEPGSKYSSTSGGPFNYGWTQTEYYNEPLQDGGSQAGYCQAIGYDSLNKSYDTVTSRTSLLIGSTMYSVNSQNSAFTSTGGASEGPATCQAVPGNSTYPAYVFSYENSGGGQRYLWWITTPAGG